jgi:hypothetical protein
MRSRGDGEGWYWCSRIPDRPLDAIGVGSGMGGALVPGATKRSTSPKHKTALFQWNVARFVHLGKGMLPVMPGRH